jgi:hypothetical protein
MSLTLFQIRKMRQKFLAVNDKWDCCRAICRIMQLDAILKFYNSPRVNLLLVPNIE